MNAYCMTVKAALQDSLEVQGRRESEREWETKQKRETSWVNFETSFPSPSWVNFVECYLSDENVLSCLWSWTQIHWFYLARGACWQAACLCVQIDTEHHKTSFHSDGSEMWSVACYSSLPPSCSTLSHSRTSELLFLTSVLNVSILVIPFNLLKRKAISGFHT